ncbi:hypothetical protein T440DRAFT_81025 [Plenodomus tracheiphilus IPT5]|uniref:Uncharacterized protein n=1 Tax=Plenodomus tracheiphilus IPT5 TaxID=1408161 RepID=A0A6A7B8F0_9PLEO|nr:hypothetical protein T440DRAFT_81025 [Plenodomus tracheiphilus IPT5]
MRLLANLRTQQVPTWNRLVATFEVCFAVCCSSVWPQQPPPPHVDAKGTYTAPRRTVEVLHHKPHTVQRRLSPLTFDSNSLSIARRGQGCKRCLLAMHCKNSDALGLVASHVAAGAGELISAILRLLGCPHAGRMQSSM